VELCAAFLLIVGIAGELLGESKTASIGDQISGFLNVKAGEANERAAAAEKEAAESNERAKALEKQGGELRSKNLALEAEIAPRTINASECAGITSAVKSFSGLTVRVATYTLDIDGGSLGWQIADCLELSQSVTVDRELASILPIGAFGVGVFVSGSHEALAFAIKEALIKANVRVLPGTGIFPPNQMAYHAGALPDPAATVVVGIKPTVGMK
jgi:hypothetical protein